MSNSKQIHYTSQAEGVKQLVQQKFQIFTKQQQRITDGGNFNIIVFSGPWRES